MARTDKRSVLEDKLKTALIACVLLICSPFLRAQNAGPHSLGEIKRWRFHLENGEIDIKLSGSLSNKNDHTVLSLEPDGGSRPTVSEEAGLLRQVLREMSSLRYDTSNLQMISTWLQNSEFLEGVEREVFKSGKWKSCTGRKYCYEAEGVADQFLNFVNAFKEFDAILQEYGLRRKAVHMDDMGVGMKNGQILCSGLIVISLEKGK